MRPSRFRTLTTALLASLLITFLIAITGGASSPLFVLYLFVLAGTFRHGSLGVRAYSAALAVALYTGLLFQQFTKGEITLAFALGHAFLVAGMVALTFHFLNLVWKERLFWQKQNSRSTRLAAISDLMNGGAGSLAEKMRKVGRSLSDEVERDGLRARIVLHDAGNGVLPPPGGEWGVYMPLELKGRTLGTLLISHRGRRGLSATDQSFFEAVARSLAAFLYRERMWDDFKAELRRIEAASLLSSVEE